MRRFSLALAASLTLAGCSNLGDLFTARADVAATAAGRKLTAEQLADLLAKMPQPTLPVAEFVANVWVDMMLYGQEVAAGTLHVDSAMVEDVMWPQLAEQRVSAWRDTLVARRGPSDPTGVDTLWAGGSVRIFQHILLQPKGATAKDTAEARREAQSILARVRGGGDFGAQAAVHNPDATRDDHGFLPPSPRGAFVPVFDSVAWTLEPGALSGVVQSPFGFHLIRRPPLDETRSRFAAYLDEQSNARADSTYFAQLLDGHRLKVRANAPALMKAAVDDLHGSMRSRKTLAEMTGGDLTVGDFAKWMTAFPPGQLDQLKQQPDSNLSQFTRVLAQQVLLLRQADSAKIDVPPAIWQAMQLTVRAGISQASSAAGLADSTVADSTQPLASRRAAAADKINAYFENLVAGKAQFAPLPGTLGAVLRRRGKNSLSRAGIARAVELAQAKAPATPPGAQRPPAGAIEPAPGPAPVPTPGQ